MTIDLPNKLLYNLKYLGIIDSLSTRTHNVGESNYSDHLIQPWSIWLDYPELTSFDHDIIKRVLRTKTIEGQSEIDSRIEDYQKIIHICQERIRQLSCIADGEYIKPSNIIEATTSTIDMDNE